MTDRNEPNWVKESAESAPIDTEPTVPDQDREMNREPTHPGVYLQQFIDQADFSVRELADLINVSHTKLYKILNEKWAIKSELAVKLSNVFKPDADFWVTKMKDYNLNEARIELDGSLQNIRDQVSELQNESIGNDELEVIDTD